MTNAQCPVCGFAGLAAPPWTQDGASDEICPSCGIQFGYDDAAGGDVAGRTESHRTWRSRWVSAGMSWWSQGQAAPDGWDPVAQLRSIRGIE